MYGEYSELPLLLFLKIAKDESKIHLLGYKKKKKARKFWEHCKDKWDENHPSTEWAQRRNKYKQCLSFSVKLKKLKFIYDYIVSTDIVPSKEFFEVAELKYTKELSKTLEEINKKVKKLSNQLEIYNAQYNALIKSLNEKGALEKDEANIHEVISTLEMATGIPRPHFKITIGEYEGDQKGLERKSKALENGKR